MRPDTPSRTEPAILISYEYMDVSKFEQECHTWNWRELLLDSGAFSAWNKGAVIDLNEYVQATRRIQAADGKRLAGIFALDVIGDWRASKANTEAMWRAGVECIPTFHWGEPWDVLKGYARDYPRIAISCPPQNGVSVRLTFANQCFARVWPKRIHGLGYGSEKYVGALPFHSVDAASWIIRPQAFGTWQAFDHKGGSGKVAAHKRLMRLRVTTDISLRAEVEYYLAIEHRARGRWQKTMKEIDAATVSPTVYLAAPLTPMAKRKLGI